MVSSSETITKKFVGRVFFIFLQKRKIKAMKTEKRRKNEEKGEKEWKE